MSSGDIIKVSDLKDKLGQRIGNGTCEGIHYEAGYMPPCSLYVEALGKVAYIDTGNFIAAAIRRIQGNTDLTEGWDDGTR